MVLLAWPFEGFSGEESAAALRRRAEVDPRLDKAGGFLLDPRSGDAAEPTALFLYPFCGLFCFFPGLPFTSCWADRGRLAEVIFLQLE